jgi:hypothetical protein
MVDFEKIDRQIIDATDSLAKNDFTKLPKLIDFIEKNLADDPDAYVTLAWKLLIRSENYRDNRLFDLCSKVYQRAISLNVDFSPYRLGQQIDIIDSRIRGLIYYDDELTMIQERRNMSEKILHCMVMIQSYIDDNWNEDCFNPDEYVDIPKNEPDLLTGMFNGPYFVFQLLPERIKNKDTREKFERQVKEAKNKLKQAELQRLAKKARHNMKDGQVVKDFLISMYSLRPFAMSELEKLLKDNKVDEAFAKEILAAVKKAEAEIPPPSEYRNWQSKDGLFKAKAKFISSDDKNVTLEKEDGKQTTIELSVLRSVDQRFVKEINSKPQSPKSN